jgi:HEAT repeat protein
VADGAQWVALWRQLQQRDDAAPHLAAIIRDNPQRRHKALSTLTRTSPREVVEALLTALGDERRPVRRLAIARLGDSGAEAAVEALLTVLRSGQPPDLRSEAVRALAKIGSRAATDAIAAALLDPDPAVREAAAAALYDLRDRSAESALRAALDDEYRLVREWARRALMRLSKTPSAAPSVDRTDLTLPGSWYTDPLIHAESQIYTFREDGTGEVEDVNMGLVNERTPFAYRVDGDQLEFRFGDESEPRRTRFRLDHGTFRHPYEGEQPCAVLEFAREPYFTSVGPLEDVTYYQLPGDP